MDDRMTQLLDEYIRKAILMEKQSELSALDKQYSKLLSELTEPGDIRLRNDIFDMALLLVSDREELLKTASKRTSLSRAEKAENTLIQRLLDENLFAYHFQPIIRASDGEIYGYEALMRANGLQGITPFHILKYAEMTDRLAEVEQYTFINVLKIIESKKDILAGKPVFINSMPNVHIMPQKADEIDHMLEKSSDNIVVEMIENTQFKDNELNEIKEKYRKLGIQIAIDDFGTGYSNISNLLRYTPNFVKIDRSLLSGIENNHNKKHFVREIIDFCHDNGIMALAEGVENSEELRTVILLGADLIQGYYTARPSPEILPEIPYEIRTEIRSHRLEYENGRRLRIYNAENGEKISLERLSKEGYSCIQIGIGYSEGSVTISGTQHFDSGVHFQTADGFSGDITLENARLSNTAERPTIDLGKNNNIRLMLKGVNRLTGSGIKVPESSALDLEGDGNLDIKLSRADYYGIGNDLQSAHGKLSFDQDGTVSITAESHAGVCIGSGLGGEISINRGRYVLNATGSMSVGVGSVDGATKISMVGCDFEATASGAYSTVIGSMYADTDVSIMYSSVKCTSDSMLAAGIGSINGNNTHIHAESVNITLLLSADAVTGFGSLNGASDIQIERSSLKLNADGTGALAFGGDSGNTRLDLHDIDVTAELSTSLDACVKTDSKNINIVGGRYRITLNGRKMDMI